MATGRLGAGDTAIQPTILDAKGDLIVATAADTPARLAVGSANQVLTVDSATATGLKWATPAAGGKVLQVVFGSTSAQAANATTTFVDTNLTATITPSSASSKILVLVSQNGVLGLTNTSGCFIRLMRGSTVIAKIVGSVGYNATSTTRNDVTASICYLDEPATTSAVTYKTQFAQRTANATSVQVQVTDSDDTSTIILMEIGA